MLFYSHIWDFLLKAASLVATVALIVALHADERLTRLGLAPGARTFVIVGTIAVLWGLAYRQALSTVAAWLYASVSLGTPMSLSEARRLARLFQLDLSLKWVPLKEVKRLPRTQRKDALFTALAAVGPTRKAMLF